MSTSITKHYSPYITQITPLRAVFLLCLFYGKTKITVTNQVGGEALDTNSGSPATLWSTAFLMWRAANVFCKGWHSKYFRFSGLFSLCHDYSTVLLQCKSSHSQLWPCSTKNLLHKKASLIKPIAQFAHPISRDSINTHQIQLDQTVLETKHSPCPQMIAFS